MDRCTYMKSLLNIPTCVLVSYLVRLIVTGASLGDALVVIGLSALYGGWVYLESKKDIPVNKPIIDRLCDLEEQLKITKDNLANMKLSTQLKIR